MIIEKKLYIGEMTKHEAVWALRRLKKNKLCPGFVVITLPLADNCMLEIYDVSEFKQKYYADRYDDIHIIGIAHTKRGAMRLTRDIVQDIHEKTGGFDVTNYFMQGV